MRRPWFAIVLAAVGLIGGIIGFTIYAEENESPFAFGTAHAGVAFEEMDNDSQRHQGRRFSCTPIGAGYRVCEVATDGPDGKMTVAVNDAGRVMVVDMTVTDSSPRVAALTGTVQGQWDRVGSGSAAVDGVSLTRTWRSADRRWSARMKMRQLGTAMDRITITDERAIDRLDGQDLASVATLLELERRRLIGDTALAAVEARTPGILRRTADSVTARARRRAWEVSKLNHCERTLEPTDPPQGEDPTAERMAPHDSLLDRAIAEAYPGLQLVATNRFYLSPASGRGEPIDLTEPTYDAAGERFAFAVTFAGRADSIESRAGRDDTRLPCRIGFDVIVARIDTVTRAISDVRRYQLEHWALAARARSLHFLVGGDTSSQLVATYEATYADSGWLGTIVWEAAIPRDGYAAPPPRPSTFTKRSGATEIRGALVPDSAAATTASDAISGRRITFLLEEKGTEPSLRRVVMPSPLNDRQSGWTLLAMF